MFIVALMNTLEQSPAAESTPVAERYPGYGAEVAARAERLALVDRANAATLPGALREAFAGDPPSLHGFTLQPVTMGLHPILVRINSPLLEVVRIMREELSREDETDMAARQQRAVARAAKEVQAEEETVIETVYCFVTPAARLRELLRQGKEKFRETVMREFGDKIHPAQFADLQQLISTYYVKSFITAIQHKAADGQGGGSPVFTAPPADAKTASAGGSMSSAH